MSVLAVVGIVLAVLFVLACLAGGALWLAYLFAEGFKH